MKTSPSTLLSALVLPVCLTGCLSAGRGTVPPDGQKRTFAPEAGTAAPQSARFAAIKIRTFRVQPPFDTPSFTVRRSESEFVRDFYNAWIAAPGDLIRTQTARYLRETLLFADVYDASSATLPPLGLEGVVSELDLDFSGPKPTAVVTLRLLVLDERSPDFRVLFSAERTGRVTFDARNPAAASQAISQALTRALEGLAHALAAAPLPAI